MLSNPYQSENSSSTTVFRIALTGAIYLVLLDWFLGVVDFSLKDTFTEYWGYATKEDVDVGARVRVYYRLLIFSGLSLPLIYFWTKRLAKDHRPKELLSTISVLLSVNIIAQFMGMQNDALCFALGLVFFVFLVLFWRSKTSIFAKKLLSPHRAGFGLCLFISIKAVIYFLFNSAPGFEDYEGTFNLMLAFFIGLSYFVFHIMNWRFSGLVRATLPIFFLPLLFFVSLEILFTVDLVNGKFLPYKWIALGLFILGAGFYYWKGVKWFKKRDSGSLLSKWLYPLSIFSFLLLSTYTPIQTMPAEEFELANPANGQMRWFVFEQWPFFDFLNSHFLYELWYGNLYHWLHGYSASLDFLIFDFLNKGFSLAIFYWLFRKLKLQASLCFALIILFPAIGSFISSSLLAALALFLVYRSWIQNHSIARGVFIPLVILILFFWRLDIGVSAAFAYILYMLMLWSANRKSFFHENVRELSIITIASAIAGIGTVLLFVPWIDFVAAIKSAFHYVKANQAHGYPEMGNASNPVFFRAHFVLPFVSLLGILLAFRSWRKTKDFQSKTLQHAGVFLLLLFLVNVPRGLVRHGFPESTDAYLHAFAYLGLSLLLFSWLRKYVEQYMQAGVFVGLAFGTILLFKVFPIHQGSSHGEKLLTESTWTKLDHHLNPETFTGRTIGERDEVIRRHGDLLIFFEKHLRSTQTFLDFSNNPLIYFYSGRRVPSYFCQSLQNTVDDYLQLEQIRPLSTNQVPVVIYSNYPRTWFDQTDGVPNNLRQYILAEHIYSNYRPFRVISNKSVWLPKQARMVDFLLEKDTLISKPETHEYKYMAKNIARYFDWHKEDVADPKNLNFDKETSQRAVYKSGMLTDSRRGLFLRLELENVQANQQVEVKLLHQGELIGSNTFLCTDTDSSYMVRLSNHYLWHERGCDEIQVLTEGTTSVLKMEWIEDTRHEYR